MKSFKSSDWDELENLPDPFEKIYTFKNYIRTKNTAYLHAEEQAFAYAGFYIKITIKGFPIDKLAAHPKDKPLVRGFASCCRLLVAYEVLFRSCPAC